MSGTFKPGAVDYSALIADRTEAFTGREWVFAAIDRWLTSSHERVFLLTGGPGSGKSAVAARLAQLSQAAEPSRAVAPTLAYYHFCQAGRDNTLDPLRFIQGLSLALARRYESFREVLLNQGDQNVSIQVEQIIGAVAEQGQVTGVEIKDLHVGHLSARASFNRIVQEPLAQIAASGVTEPILVMIDALDEALTYDPDENLVNLLGHIIKDSEALPANVRFLLTSRLDERVTHQLGRPTLDLVDSAPDALEDVRLYVSRGLQHLSEPWRSELAEQIAVVAKGNFLCARYLLHELPADATRLEEARARLLPTSLREVYGQFLQRELGRNLDRWDAIYSPFLGVLAAARGDGLTRNQLEGITGLGQRDLRRLLRVCRQYLAGNEPDGPFHLYHQSFRDFLLEDDTFFVDPSEDNLKIARFFLDLYGDHWSGCEEPYALQFTPTYLVAALDVTPSGQVRQQLVEKLTQLLTDFEYLNAKAGRVGIAELLSDLRLAMAHLPPKAPEQEAIATVREVLQREARNLWDWTPDLDPARFAQQVHLRATRLAWPPLRDRAEAEMRAQHKAHWRLRWLGGRASPAPPGYQAGHEGPILAVATSPDGRLALTASADHTVRMWDLATGRRGQVLRGHEGPVTGVAVTPNGRLAISTSDDLTLRVWTLPSGQSRHVLAGHGGLVEALAITADGRLAVTASADWALGVWDVQRGRLLHMLEEHDDCVEAIALLGDGWHALSASADQTLRLWDLVQGQTRQIFYGREAPFTAVAVSASGTFAVSAADDGTLRQWDLRHGRSLGRLAGDGVCVSALVMTPDDRMAVGAAEDGSLRLWDLKGGHGHLIPPGHRRAVTALATSQDSQFVFSVSDDRTLRAWSVADGRAMARVALSGSLRCLALASNNAVLTGDATGTVYCLDMALPGDQSENSG